MPDDRLGTRLILQSKNVALAKISVFAFSGALAAMAGSLYAHHASYFDPAELRRKLYPILILLMVMLGGAGTLYGPVVGAITLTLLPALLRFIPAPPGVAAASKQLVMQSPSRHYHFSRPQGTTR